ncbi:unnamed protein product [Amaranthus hypochondriacus]
MDTHEPYEKPRKGAHVLVFPYPLQGHINPMLQFSKLLASKGLKITIITTTTIPNHISPSQSQSNPSPLDFVRIFDGCHGEPDKRNFDEYINLLKVSTSRSLHGLLEYYNQNKMDMYPGPNMVIYDSFMPWVLKVVKDCGFQGAPFFTQSCLVNSIYYYAYKGDLISPFCGSDLVSMPSVESLLRVHDLPTFVSYPTLYPEKLVKLLLDQFSNLEDVSFVFINTVDVLESKVIEFMARQWPVKTIGPCIPSMYLDKCLKDDKDYGLSLLEPQIDACIKWLDTRETCSVVYVSMGSLASLESEQMEQIANALVKSKKYFLWVVRPSEVNKLPLNFKEITLKRGLIVNWCHQFEVLSHIALACFVTHCGWNSILEAISLGVPIVGFPQWTDQPTNAKCIVEFWKIGVKVRVDEKGFLSSDELEFCIREVMEGEHAKEFKSNANKWKLLIKHAMELCGSSNRNIEEFASTLLSTSL